MKCCTFALSVTKFALFLSKFQHRSEEERKLPMVDGSEERSGRLAIAPWATVGCPVSPTNLLPILLNTHHLGVSL